VDALREELARSQEMVAELQLQVASLRPTAGESAQTVQNALLIAKSAGNAASAKQMDPDKDASASWSVPLWLDSLSSLSLVVGDVLLSPFENDVDEATQLAFIKELGRADSTAGPEAVLRLLKDGALLAKLAAELWQGARKLANARAATVGELQSKFLDEAAFTMSYGGMDTFFGGLEKLLGPPSAQLREAMRREHCASADSKEPFLSPNYGVNTSAKIEWFFVVDPETGLATLGLEAWPIEETLLKASQEFKAASSRRSQRQSEAEVEGGGGRSLLLSEESTRSLLDDEEDSELDSRLEDPATRMREPQSIKMFEAEWAKIDEKLEELDIDYLQEVELLGGRLYTGPMYVKYNAALRGIEGNAFMQGNWTKLCKGNRYTTTLHVINSAVVKLAKLQPAAKVYRGVSGGMLPSEFWKPNEHNVRGGCEYGFLSTTTDSSVATDYASSGGKSAIVFEIAMGLVDRGASLSWLSQYPHEEEILFAPLTGVELVDARVQGAVLVVEVRLSVNLTNRTIEEVVAKMQSSALGLIELMRDDFLHHGAPSRSLEPLESFYQLTDNQDPDWYNRSENYQSAVKEALDRKRQVLHVLTQ
jgi:hypothetical protein